MQYRVDGDQLMICGDSFINLQESPVTFIPLKDPLAQVLLAERPFTRNAMVRFFEWVVVFLMLVGLLTVSRGVAKWLI